MAGCLLVLLSSIELLHEPGRGKEGVATLLVIVSPWNSARRNKIDCAARKQAREILIRKAVVLPPTVFPAIALSLLFDFRIQNVR